MYYEIFRKPFKIWRSIKRKIKAAGFQLMGHSNYHSEFDIWSYNLIQNIFFRREMVVFFSENVVLDVLITDFFLGNKIKEYVY